MTISQALANASSGLSAAAQRANVTSNNIANALTDGYSRRDVTLSERVTGGVGAGVTVSGVTRAENAAITYERRIADGELAFENAAATALGKASDLLGGPEDANALFQKYVELESSLRALADAPDNTAAQQKVVSAANGLTDAFVRIESGLQTTRAEADNEIAARVDDINAALQKIENLNSSISRGAATGTDVSALLDQRQRLVDAINESLPVRELQRDDGKIDLMTTEGVFLLAGTARKLSFSATPVITAQSEYASGAGALSGLSVDGVEITPGGPSAQSPKSGAIAGLFAVRDDIIPQAARNLDALALDAIERFSEAGLDPTLPAGAPGLFTDAGAPGDPSNLIGMAGRIVTNSAVDPTQGGDVYRIRDGLGAVEPAAAGSDSFVRSLIAAMSDGRPTHTALQASSELNAAEAAAHVTSLVGGVAASRASEREAASALSQALSDAEIQETGVDTDRELQNLLTIEQAYAANARVIQTIDQLIQRLLEI